jgi:hypothetical protein
MHATTVRSTGTPRGGRTRLVVPVIAALVGFAWILQGLGVLPGSFMTGDRFWTWAGAALVIVALAYAAWPRLRRR